MESGREMGNISGRESSKCKGPEVKGKVVKPGTVREIGVWETRSKRQARLDKSDLMDQGGFHSMGKVGSRIPNP